MSFTEPTRASASTGSPPADVPGRAGAAVASPDDRNRRFYDDIAPRYHDLRYGGRYGRLFRRLHHEILGELLTGFGGARVLEVACGTGHTTELLQARGLDFVACDLTPGMMAQARQRVGGDVAFVRANALRLPFPDASFDALVSTRFLHLFGVDRQREILAEMVRVLRPGGRLIVDFDNFTSRWLIALPHLVYNLVRYRRFAPEAEYNRIPQVERVLGQLGLEGVRSIGVGGYHLVLATWVSDAAAMTLGRRHRRFPLRFLAEQFVTTGVRAA